MKSKFLKLIKRRQFVGTASMFILVALIFGLVNNPMIVGVSATTRELPIYSVERQDKVVALSFDAAWGNEDTEELIAILEKYSVKTTFFVVGDWVEKYPESVKALSDAGHEIMNHSNNHAHFSKLCEQEIMDDINSANDKIEEITGVRPTLFRAPYGEYDDHVIKTVRDMGMNTIQWDVDSLDWKDLSASEITSRVTSKIQSGSIVLFHNAAKNTPEALPSILEFLISEGYAVVPISQIILDGEEGINFTIDHTGKQVPAK